ncbi:hypothetical protein [Methyloferula stellata]|uniref:hypothetical protein n=1 Tax=Methyloferula stellata TaxID=876270 RepID=UPI00036377E3|nr:hypothetical protein [Methyloferula stellata]
MRPICRLPHPGVALFIVISVAGMGSVSAACDLRSPAGKIKHAIHLQFGNLHPHRDNLNISSGLARIEKGAEHADP